MSTETSPLLRVRGLEVSYGTGVRQMTAVRGVDLDVRAGEVVALVGESGSGKSSAARGILQLTRPSSGTVELGGQELTTLNGRALREARRGVQMIFQDPYSSLDPSMTVGEAIAEPLMVHTKDRSAERRRKVLDMLDRVGLNARHIDRYPHEFSGGQRQRVAIARALILHPGLLVADEAVSALDVSSQNQVLALLSNLIRELDLACLFITHDLAVVRSIADRVAVMYLGTLVEQGPTEELFARPQHPYTAALLSAALVADPVIQRQRTRIRLTGELPDPRNPPAGCAFSTRCPHVREECQQPPALRPLGVGMVACHRSEELGADLAAVGLRSPSLIDTPEH